MRPPGTDQSVGSGRSELLGSIYPIDRFQVSTTAADRSASRALRTDQSDGVRPTQGAGAIWPMYRFRVAVTAEQAGA